MNPLHKKLGIKSNQKICLINTPDELKNPLFPLPEQCTIVDKLKGEIDVIQVFAVKKSEIEKIDSKLIGSLSEKGFLWIAYPKKNSGLNTDLNRDLCWNLFSSFGFRPVTLVSLNDNWASIRFKSEEEVNKKKQDQHKTDEFNIHIDKVNRTVKAPEDLAKLLIKEPGIKEYFESLAFTHKKEYVQWILEAKREETRAKRVTKTIEMLKAGKKNPGDK